MKINITKRFLLSLCLMTLTLLCGGNKAWAAEQIYTHTFADGDFGTNTDARSHDATLSKVAWSVSASPKFGYLSKGSNTYAGLLQIGSKSDPCEELKLETSAITGTIKSITLNACAGATRTVTMSVGGTSYLCGTSSSASLTTSKTNYIFSGSSSGKISISISGSSKALYLGSIKIVYEEVASTPAPTFSLEEGTYNGPQHVTITAPKGYTEGIVYTTDGTEPTTSDINYTSAGIDITTTTTLRAVAYDSKGNSSGEAKATYTITYNAPTFSLAGGTYYGDQSVSISVKDLGTGSILYTTNGDDPKTKGTKYTEAIPLPVGPNLTLKAVAKYGEGLFSEVTEATYDIQKASPTFFQRITSAAELTANETYLIVCERESENVAFGEISNNKGTPQDVTITGNKIYLSAAGTGTPIEFILEVSGKNYKLKNASTGNYLNFSSTSTDITETASGTALSISFDNTEGNVKIAGANISTRQLIYRASTYNVFGNYGNDNVSASGYNKVYLYKKHVIKEFSDTEDLATSLPTSPLADQTVTLDRKVYSGWNTFCVPFKLTQAQLEKAYGNGAVAKYLSDVTTDGAAATLHFTPEEGGGIEANKAYLLYLTADVKKPKTFSGVTLQRAGDCTTTVRADNGGDYTFQGILTPTALETNDRQYFLNSAGTYFVLPLNNTSQMKATRAYIIVPAPAAPAQGRQYSFDFNGTTTAIDNVNVSGMEDGAWYTISGIRINRPAAKGVYIHNGRKVIVK